MKNGKKSFLGSRFKCFQCLTCYEDYKQQKIKKEITKKQPAFYNDLKLTRCFKKQQQQEHYKT